MRSDYYNEIMASDLGFVQFFEILPRSIIQLDEVVCKKRQKHILSNDVNPNKPRDLSYSIRCVDNVN